MISIELRGAADADLDSILDYGIEAYGRNAAEAYLRLIHATLDRLAQFPEIGSPRPELREGLRTAPVNEHLL